MYQLQLTVGEIEMMLTHIHVSKSFIRLFFLFIEISAGMVTMIHDNTELPLIDVAGIHLIPGRKHRLTYRKKTSYFLQSPYTDCTEKIPLSMQTMFDQYVGADFAYSQDVCRLNCKQSYTSVIIEHAEDFLRFLSFFFSHEFQGMIDVVVLILTTGQDVRLCYQTVNESLSLHCVT